MAPSASPARLPPVVRQLGAVSFFNDVASEMVYPLLPALITVRLGGTALSLALLDGVAEAVSSGVKLASGWLAERPRLRPRLVIGGYATAVAARPVMALVGAAWHVVALRAVDRVGKGVRTPARDAVIADAVPAVLRGRAFGFHRGMDHAGAVLGPLAASALLGVVGLTVPAVVLWSAVPGLVAVGVVVGAMRRLPLTSLPSAGEREPSRAPVAPLRQRRRGPLLFVLGFAFARLPETLLLLRLQELGVALAIVPLLWAVLHVVRSSASYPGGWLSDTIGPLRTMQVGWVTYAVICLGLASAGSPVEGAGWFLAFGVVAALTESPERALVAMLGGPGPSGRLFGVYHAGIGLTALPGALVLGSVWMHVGATAALAVSAAAALALAGGAVAVRSPLGHGSS